MDLKGIREEINRVDYDGDEKVRRVLEKVEKKGVMYKLLGCYNSTE